MQVPPSTSTEGIHSIVGRDRALIIDALADADTVDRITTGAMSFGDRTR